MKIVYWVCIISAVVSLVINTIQGEWITFLWCFCALLWCINSYIRDFKGGV